MLILEDLYLGDVRPSERSFKRSSQYARALHEVIEANDASAPMRGNRRACPRIVTFA